MLLSALIILFLLIIGIFFFLYYNRLITAKNLVDEAFSGIDVQLRKRYDLIPNLVKLVKIYSNYEFKTFLDIVESRSQKKNTIESKIEEDNMTSIGLRNLELQIESYPVLKADEQFKKLMDELSLIENELVMARRYFNGTARNFNIKAQQFPGSLVAKVFRFSKQPYFENLLSEEDK